jgi:hypothetical protein
MDMCEDGSRDAGALAAPVMCDGGFRHAAAALPVVGDLPGGPARCDGEPACRPPQRVGQDRSGSA